MKSGDKFPVTIAGEEVAQATVKEVDEDKATATMVIPATLVTMSYRTHDELTPGDPAEATPTVEGSEHILLTDQVVTPGDAVTPQQAATQQVPGTPEAPTQPDTAPTPAQEPVVPAVPEEVEQAVERQATGSEEPL